MNERKQYLKPRVGDKVLIHRTSIAFDSNDKEYDYYNGRIGVVTKTAWFLRADKPIRVRFQWFEGKDEIIEEWFHQFSLEVIERVA